MNNNEAKKEYKPITEHWEIWKTTHYIFIQQSQII